MRATKVEAWFKEVLQKEGETWKQRRDSPTHPDCQDDERGCVWLTVQEGTVGQVWKAFKSLLRITIDDTGNSDELLVECAPDSLHLLRYYSLKRNEPESDESVTWIEMVECSLKFRQVPEFSGSLNVRWPSAKRGLIDFVEGKEQWETVRARPVKRGMIVIGVHT